MAKPEEQGPSDYLRKYGAYDIINDYSKQGAVATSVLNFPSTTIGKGVKIVFFEHEGNKFALTSCNYNGLPIGLTQILE